MAIVWTRIDDRLIHGQVASSWLSHVKAEQAIIVDDEVIKNDVQMNVLKMAAPAIKVHIFGIDRFIDIYHNKPISRRTILILSDTSIALRLKEGGVKLDYINYGGMRRKLGRIEYRNDLCFSPKELEDLKRLLALGVKVDYQMAAYDTPESLSLLLEKYI